MDRSQVLVTAGSAAMLSVAVVWGATIIADAVRETNVGGERVHAETRNASPAVDRDQPKPRASHAPHPAAVERESQPGGRHAADEVPRAAARERLRVVSHDVFERAWRKGGHVQAASSCWTKVEVPPESVTFDVMIAEDGTVLEVEPDALSERAPEALRELHLCVADVIRTMKFEAVTGGQSLIQVNRDW